MQAMEFVHPGSIEPDAARATAVLEACRDRGLLVGKGGLYGNVIRVTPMLNVTEAEIDEGAAALDGSARRRRRLSPSTVRSPVAR